MGTRTPIPLHAMQHSHAVGALKLEAQLTRLLEGG